MLKRWIQKLKTSLMKHKGWVLGGIVVVAAAGVGLSGGAAAEVTAAVVETGSVTKVVEATATVESRTSRSIQSLVSGEVQSVLAETGDAVSPGDALAVIDVTDISLSLRALEAQRASLQASMQAAEKPGADVLRQAEALMKADAVNLGAARRAAEQARALNASGAGSNEELLTAEEALARAEQAAAASESAYSRLKSGLTVYERARYQADIDAVQAQIDQVTTNRSRYAIAAPVGGIVTLRNLETGQMVTPGTELFQIDDPAEIRLGADILVQDAARLAVGALVTARDEEAGITVTGTISKIEPKAFSKLSDLGIEQKRIRIEALPKEHPAELRLGMELDMEVEEARSDAVLYLPDSAVFRIDGTPHVFRIVGNKAFLTAIETGLEGKDTMEVKSGLKAGDQVVDAPGNDLKDGARIKIK